MTIPKYVAACGLLLLALCPVHARVAHAQQIDDYTPSGSRTLPAGTAVFDVTPAGRLVVLSGTDVLLESAPGSGSFSPVGTLPGPSIPFPGFIRVSPDGQRVAIGNGGGASFNDYQVGVFSLATLSGSWFAALHFDAAWIDDRYLALSAGQFGSPAEVVALDTQSPSPATPVLATLVDNIGGASGGVAFDAAGNLFTANGFTGSGPSGTGAVYAVAQADWSAALAGGAAVDFEAAGIPVVDLLSGSPLGFDAAGNLLVGGGDLFGSVPDGNYFALVDAGAIAAALGGAGLIDGTNPAQVRKLDPDPAADSRYAVLANPARGELYALASGASSTYVYAASPAVAAVPALPSDTLYGLFAGLVLLVGWQQRRGRSGSHSGF